VRKRLQVYHQQTRPLVDYYAGWERSGEAQAPRLRRIEGTGSVEQVTQRIAEALR
jgi:adenylate kinase